MKKISVVEDFRANVLKQRNGAIGYKNEHTVSFMLPPYAPKSRNRNRT